LRFRELAAEEFDVAARTRASVRAQQAHAVEKNQKIKNVGVFQGGKSSAFGLLLFYFGNEIGECGVELAGQSRVWRLFVVDAGAQRSVGFGQRLDCSENVGVGSLALGCAELRDREGERRHQLLLRVNDVGRQIDVQQRCARWQGARVLVLVAVRGQQVGAVRRAINRDFPACAAANGADRFSLGGTVASAFALFADGTDHTVSDNVNTKKQNTPR